MDEDEVKAVFQTAFDVINKKFSIDSTSFDIVASQYGWTIKKEKQKPPTMTQLQYRCTVKDKDGRDCKPTGQKISKVRKQQQKNSILPILFLCQ